MAKLLVLLLPFSALGAVSSFVADHSRESHLKSLPNDNGTLITQALYHIAKILETNQPVSKLNERVSILEARLELSTEKNRILESRLNTLENKVPDVSAKIASFTKVMYQMEGMESATNELMAGFEEKLSTFAAEILRLKSIINRPKMNIFKDGKSTDADEADIHDEREVEVRVMCLSSPSPLSPSLSKSSPASPSHRNISGCLFTSGRKLVPWTMANLFCDLRQATLLSFSEANSIQQIKGTNAAFWISEDSVPKDHFVVSEGEKYLHEESSDVNSIYDAKSGRIDASGDDNLETRNVLVSLDENPENESLLVDIRNLPNLDEVDKNIERNVYLSNVRPDYDINNVASFVGDPENSEAVHRVTRRSLEHVKDINKLEDDKKYKEFLLLQPMESESGQTIQMIDTEHSIPLIEETGHNTRQGIPLLEDSEHDNQSLNGNEHSILSDSSSLFSSVKGKLYKLRSAFDNSNTINPDKKCTLLVCTEGSSTCVVELRRCSERRPFWCKRKG